MLMEVSIIPSTKKKAIEKKENNSIHLLDY